MEEIRQARSLLVAVGEIKSFSERQTLIPFFQSTALPFCLDVTSGIKYLFHLENGALPCFSHPEVPAYLKEQDIDTILHIGGRMTSKEYYRFLKENPSIKVTQCLLLFLPERPRLANAALPAMHSPASLCSQLPSLPPWIPFPSLPSRRTRFRLGVLQSA